MNEISTVSVIERCEPGQIILHGFPDNPEGDRMAEELFRKIAAGQRQCPGIERKFSDAEIEGALDDGYLDDPMRGWELYILHSSGSNQG